MAEAVHPSSHPIPRVSVLLPVRNGARTLGAAIASIQRQTLTDWELLVLDDGSSDESLPVARAAAAGDPRILVVPLGQVGLVAALNAGLEKSRGALIARMDADDECDPRRFAEQVAFLNAPRHAHIGLVGSGIVFGGDAVKCAGYALHVDWLNRLTTPAEIALNRFVESPFAHPSVMFRREVVRRFGGYRCGEFPEDYELWLRWLAAGVAMAKLPEPLLTWNDAPARLSRTNSRYDPDAFFRIKAPYIAQWLAAERVQESRRVLVWGAGRPTRKRAAHLGLHGVTVSGYIDVDVKKTTPAIGGTGRPVIAAAEVPPPGQIFVLGYVTSRGAREMTRDHLRERGYVEGRDFLMCA
jgi:cellulose synthase/poly-beta-1,6-N-acetylglucosamine synthase-like glycosyltransferase